MTRSVGRAGDFVDERGGGFKVRDQQEAYFELRGVSKGFGEGPDRTEVLSDINLTLGRGEFLAIVGFSGSGKSTLINMLAGLITPDTGTIELEGKPVVGPGPDRGVVFQNYSLLPWLTVAQNVRLAVDAVFDKRDREERATRVRHHLEMVGLGGAHWKYPRELSGGMRQRLSVARALAMDPKILLLDEPLSALDALTRATLQSEIESIWAADRKSVLMITNDVDEAILLADRIVPLRPGPRASLGPSFEVPLARPRDRTTVNDDPEFIKIRNEITHFLTAAARQAKRGSERRRIERPRVEPRNFRPKIRPTAR